MWRRSQRLEMANLGTSDGIWMTKAEFAAARRISLGTANRLIRQRRWKRQPGDDGLTRVLVPRRWAEDRVASAAVAATAPMSSSPGAATVWETPSGNADAWGDELVRLRAEIETAQSARREAEGERDEERQGRITAERALSEARQELAALKQAKETAAAEERAEQITREAAFAQLRRLAEAASARRSLGRWARLKLAWRGE